ncbi:6729_t:CDS:2, partial [Funneliformis caledonium]
VVEFLESKMEVLNIEEGDVNKFVEIPDPNFFNLTEEMLTQETGNFGLKHATADNISSVVGALNILHETENKLRRFDLSLESAVILVRNLESEQRLLTETILNHHLKNVHIGDEGTRWRFKEKLALLEAILGVHAEAMMLAEIIG